MRGPGETEGTGLHRGDDCLAGRRSWPGAGENVSFFFSTNDSYQDILTAMLDGNLTVGVHAKGFSSGGSESFTTAGAPAIKTPIPTAMPTPTAAIAGLVMLGVVGIRRRRA